MDSDQPAAFPRRFWIPLVLFLLALTFGATYPLSLHLDELLAPSPDGIRSEFEDAISTLHLLELGRDVLSEGGSVWEIFHRYPYYAMPPLYFLPGWVLSQWLPAVVVHNLFLLSAVFLAGLFAFLLGYRLTRDPVAAGFAAILFASSNYLIHHVMGGQIHVVQVFWFPAVLLFTEKLLASPTGRNACWLGLCLGLMPQGCAQYAVFNTLLLPLYLLARNPAALTRRRTLVPLVLAATIGLALAAPAIFLKLSVAPRSYDAEQNIVFSLRGMDRIIPAHGYPGVGVIPVLLALAGTAAGLRNRETWATALVGMSVVAVALMFGPMSPWAPYSLLLDHWPFFDRMRTPLRFLPFVQLATAMLAAGAVAWARRGTSARKPRAALAVALAGLLLLHFLPRNRFHLRQPDGVGVWTRELPAITDAGLAPYANPDRLLPRER